MSVISNSTFALEEAQNWKNKLTASKRPFFASKLHKFKKMLKPILKRITHPPAAPVEPSIEDLQNAINEALEAKLAEDIAISTGVTEDGVNITLIMVTRDSCVKIPAHFIAAPDSDICSRDVQTMSSYQEPQQQTPILSC